VSDAPRPNAAPGKTPAATSTTAGNATTQPVPGVTASAAATGADPIGPLVERLSASHGLWQNGMFADLGLPGTASKPQVVARVFEMTGFDAGHVKAFRITETRQVRIAGSLPDVYTAVLVDTEMGRKIVLLQYGTGANPKWWSRVYDADPPPAPQQSAGESAV
jgi:hypothetical protein